MAADGALIVEREVRELIRRRGLDPVRDPGGVEALVGAVLADYDERSLLGAVPRLDDATAVHRHVLDAVSGLGPLQRYLPGWRKRRPNEDDEYTWLRDQASRGKEQLRRSAELPEKPGDNAPEMDAANLHPWAWENGRSYWNAD